MIRKITLDELQSLKEKKISATIRENPAHKTLQEQAGASLSFIENNERLILEELYDLFDNSGNFILEVLIKDIWASYNAFFLCNPKFQEADDEDNKDDTDIPFTKKELIDYSNELYNRIEVLSTLLSASDRFSIIKNMQNRIDLAKRGILF